MRYIIKCFHFVHRHIPLCFELIPPATLSAPTTASSVTSCGSDTFILCSENENRMVEKGFSKSGEDGVQD
jgi:hypothetical protein